MILAKNYETVFKFVKVMPRKLVASFFPDTVYTPASLEEFEASMASDFDVICIFFNCSALHQRGTASSMPAI